MYFVLFFYESGYLDMRIKIITNNAGVREQYASSFDVEYLEETLLQVFIRVRDYIHKGHRLLTHPLSGSVKPNDTPYKSILISGDAGQLDVNALHLIEEGIITVKKFPQRDLCISDRVLADFREVDRTLIADAISSL